jgi:hypothetical protein
MKILVDMTPKKPQEIIAPYDLNETVNVTKNKDHGGKIAELFYALMDHTWEIDGKPFNLSQRGWYAEFSKTKKALGRCIINRNEGIKKIELSKYFHEGAVSFNEIKNTILHEIAHAIDYEIRNTTDHSWRWKRICKQIGHNGERTTAIDSMKLNFKYDTICPVCNEVVGGFNRKPKRDYYHKECQPNPNDYDTWNAPLKLKQNY